MPAMKRWLLVAALAAGACSDEPSEGQCEQRGRTASDPETLRRAALHENHQPRSLQVQRGRHVSTLLQGRFSQQATGRHVPDARQPVDRDLSRVGRFRGRQHRQQLAYGVRERLDGVAALEHEPHRRAHVRARPAQRRGHARDPRRGHPAGGQRVGDVRVEAGRDQHERRLERAHERDDDVLGLADFTTHRLPLTEAPAAYAMFQAKQDGAIKVVLEP